MVCSIEYQKKSNITFHSKSNKEEHKKEAFARTGKMRYSNTFSNRLDRINRSNYD